MTCLPPDVAPAIRQLTQLQVLKLTDCRLLTLEGVPRLKTLLHLDVSHNWLNDEAVKLLGKFKTLRRLNFSHNYIQKFESVKFIRRIDQLEHLECIGNPFTALTNYEGMIWEALPRLKALNQTDR